MQGKEEVERAPSSRMSRAWLLAWLRPRSGPLSWSLCLMLAQSLATLAQPWVGGLLTERLVFGEGFGLLLWALFGLVFAQQALGYFVSVQLQAVSGHLVADANAAVYAHLQSLPLAWHQARRRGDVLALLSADVYRLSNFVTGVMVPLGPLLLTFIGALLMMFHLAPLIALTVAAVLPALVVSLKLVGRRLRPLSLASAQAWASQSAMAEQGLELMPVIKAFATDQKEVERYRHASQEVRRAEFRAVRLQGAIQPLVQVIGAGLVLFLLGIAGRFLVTGTLGVGALVSLFLYGMVLVAPMGQLARLYSATHAAHGAMQRVLGAMAAPPEVDSGRMLTLPRHGDIRYRGIEFAYPGRRALFTGLDLTVRAGETVALTGSNGVGKTTLVHMLMRLVEPQAGNITIGGFDIREFRLAALRGQIAIVAQSTMLFNATISENIGYGHAEFQQADIVNAARAARAHEFIESLPEGYQTVIGDQGVRLSGGQKQRLALARALLKDPPILILDEATAMFDPQGEAEFIVECQEVLRQRTVIMITHRPASLALADRVLQMDAGTVSEIARTRAVSDLTGNV